jgi:hypothetical protein
LQVGLFSTPLCRGGTNSDGRIRSEAAPIFLFGSSVPGNTAPGQDGAPSWTTASSPQEHLPWPEAPVTARIRMQVLHSDIDLLHPPAELEKRSHKLKRLVQSPNSFFMDVKCQGCFQMCAFFSLSAS